MLKLALALCLLTAVCGSAVAAPVYYTVALDGPSEFPPVASPGTGIASIIFDTVAHTLFIDVTFSGLVGTTTVAHIHCCTAVPGAGTAIVATPTPTFPGFPAGVSAGAYTNTFDLTLAPSFNGAFITANGGTPTSAEAALVAGAAAGSAYLNIHTSFSASGEIRGFLQPIPEPGSVALTLAGLAALALLKRR